MAFFPIRPFWNDEWRLIYNLKFKTIPELWGRLDLLQECPRVYLSLLKKFTSIFDYSYTSLRLPALLIGIVNVLFVFRLRKKLYPDNSVYSYLFTLIIISSQTFTDYLTQVKQYEMEIFASLVALWQLVTMLDIAGDEKKSNGKYILLCLSFLIIPFFSYTYPIAIAVAIPIILLKLVTKGDKRVVVKTLLPLVLVCVSIAIFYWIDVRNMMGDSRMYHSYLHMLGNDKGELYFLKDLWDLFALVGFGYVYERVFGLLGVIALGFAIYHLASHKKRDYGKYDYLKAYAVAVVIITLVLFLSGKILGGVARLTAYAVPSIAILITGFMTDLKSKSIRLANAVSVVLFLGLFGNIITTCINSFTYKEYNERVHIFKVTSEALKTARLNKVPILYTDGVRGDNIHPPATDRLVRTNTITAEQIAGVDTLCTEVILKVNPEYKVWDTIPAYLIPDMHELSGYMNQLPAQYTTAMACDGNVYMKVQR